MEKEIVELLTIQLDKIAAQLGVTGEQVWPWLVRQQYVEAFRMLFLFILSFVAACILYFSLLKIDWDKPGFTGGCLIILGVIVGATLFVSFFLCIREVPCIFNPEYWALIDLFGMTK